MYIQREIPQNTDNQSGVLINVQVTYKKIGKENRKMKNKENKQNKQSKMAYLNLTISIIKYKVSEYTH